jgi:exodeoxyribonuclease V gamma subunit
VVYIHRADRADRLVGALAGVLGEPLADPFAAEIVAVPTRGVERWLCQQLSASLGVGERGDGVCANVLFPSPRELIDEVLGAALGFEAKRDPWSPRRLLWPLLETIDEHLAEPWLSMLRSHLDPARGDRSRRLRVARHLAKLYDRYSILRPELLNGWLESNDADGWEAELWRRLRARVGCAGPAERLEAACDALRADPDLTTLPGRISLFGLTSFPVRHLEVLRALAAGGRNVHLFVLAPSAAAWEDVTRVLGEQDTPVLRGDVGNDFLPRNPLLASWGRDGRELQLVLLGGAGETQDVNHASDGDRKPETLLARLQADIRADRSPSGDTEVDESVQVHACHGAARQVEVLRDAVLHALSEDETLEPRDVIVMCPNIERFAPLIEATFGAGTVDDHEGPGTPPGPTADLRVRLADRSLRETNPVLGVLARLLEMAGARITASEVLDLADREPVRQRFRFTQDDVSRLGEWVGAIGARWGFDAQHRTRFGLEGVSQGTWEAGLNRLLSGVAIGGDELRLLYGVVPYDDVDSSSIDLAGRLAEYLERLEAIVADFGERRSLEAWTGAAAEAADALCATTGRNTRQRIELERLLRVVVEEASVDGTVSNAPLDVADFAALLEDRLAGRPTRANFRTGHLTVCTLQPMRSVPHRVICLLGLDDTVFPRRAARDGDDLLLAEPRVGERDSRSEDRQILLDALMAATDRLIITYAGNDEKTNAERAPAVPIAELLDVVERSTSGGEVIVRHPLQAFDPVNFEPGGLVGEGPWSFDAVTLDGARALASDRTPPQEFLRGPLPPAEHGEMLELERFVSFLGHPVRGFLRQRLGIGVSARVREIEDGLPLELSHLDLWEIGERLVSARLRGAEAADSLVAERARGSIPPGLIGEKRLDQIAELVEFVMTQARGVLDLDAAQQTLDVRVLLDDGRFIGGTISGLRGDVLQHVGFSRVGPRQRLGAWARLLMLTVAFPERRFSSVSVGRARKGVSPRFSVSIARTMPPSGLGSAEEREGWAREELGKLVELFDRGLREPLPLYCQTSAELASAPVDSARRRAEKAWTSDFENPREDSEEEHVQVLGAERSFAELVEEPPRDDEDWFGEQFDSRLECYAHRLWDGLLAVETVSEQ